MVSTADFRKGLVIEWQGAPFEVIWFQNHKMAAEEAVMRAKIRNMKTGSIIERTFKNGERFKDITMRRVSSQFLYSDTDNAHFMNNENYEQIFVPKEKLGDQVKFLSENMEVNALFLDDEFLSIELPASVTLKVTSTVPGIKGDSVSNLMKPATVSSGIELQVPLFVKEGDTIRVDTRTGEYLERL
ncbi:MAG TPA: elongation factor P [Elusimicrobiota bacterium]|nr:elongation factor P [Elusimicrobiota bacterium]